MMADIGGGEPQQPGNEQGKGEEGRRGKGRKLIKYVCIFMLGLIKLKHI